MSGYTYFEYFKDLSMTKSLSQPQKDPLTYAQIMYSDWAVFLLKTMTTTEDKNIPSRREQSLILV